MMENKEEEEQQSRNIDGLPFIGPGLKDQHETLQKLLRDGLLGTYNDDDDDDNTNYDNIVNIIPMTVSSRKKDCSGITSHIRRQNSFIVKMMQVLCTCLVQNLEPFITFFR